MHRVSNFLQGKDVTVEEVETLWEKLLFDHTPVQKLTQDGEKLDPVTRMGSQVQDV